MKESCNVLIDNEPYHFDVDGDFFWEIKTYCLMKTLVQFLK